MNNRKIYIGKKDMPVDIGEQKILETKGMPIYAHGLNSRALQIFIKCLSF